MVSSNSLSETAFSPDDVNRRQLLKGAALGAAGLVTRPLFAEKTVSSKAEPIIDAHSHIWTPDLAKYPLQGDQTVADLKPRSFTPEELMAVAAPHGVTKVVLIQHNIYHGTDNTYIIDTIRNEPEKYSGVARVNVRQADPVQRMKQLRNLGIRGLRILPGDPGGKLTWKESMGMNALWKASSEIGVAMCPLINPRDLPMVKEMCQKYPETTVVIDHFARIGIDGKIREADLTMLVGFSKFPNVNVKISAYYALGKKQPPHTELLPMIRRLAESFGTNRLMWASDCPYQLNGPNNYGDSIALITKHADFFSHDEKRDVLYNTAERVFFPSV